MREPLPAVFLRVGEAVEAKIDDRLVDLRQRLLRDPFIFVALNLMREEILLREFAGAGLQLPFFLRQFEVHCLPPRGLPVTSPSSATQPSARHSTGLISIS